MIKILLADDQAMFLQSLSNILDSQEGITVVSTASNGSEVIRALEDTEIDIAILDLNMPEINGLELMEKLSVKYSNLKVIFLTIYQEKYVVERLITLGASGFLLKNGSIDKLVRSVREVHDGRLAFDDVQEIYETNRKKVFEPAKLTKQEIKIIKLVTEGHSSSTIGEKLFISEYTVNTHRRNIQNKLDLDNVAQLVAFAKSSGII